MGDQPESPWPLSLILESAVRRTRAALGYWRKETGKGSAAGLNRRDVKRGEGTNDNNHLGEELVRVRGENTYLNYAKNKCSPGNS